MGLKVKNQILGVILLFSFLLYSGGNIGFEHTHIIDGTLVTHSHPYNPTCNHTHSTGSILLLGLINNSVLTIVSAIFAFQCFRHISAIFGVLNERVRIFSSATNAQLRAPPAIA